MIKIENIQCSADWSSVIRGMRNPMNSWDKSDSWNYYSVNPYIGDKDLNLMKRLVKAGPEHAKFMRMIPVYMDIIAPLYWWKEADTYKIGTVRNSCSTMHKIQSKEFDYDDFSHDHLTITSYAVLYKVIETLNKNRKLYLETSEKAYWWQLIQLLPSSYNQKATLYTNYASLRNIYFQRRNHKLDEWHEFCKAIKQLPHSELITMESD